MSERIIKSSRTWLAAMCLFMSIAFSLMLAAGMWPIAMIFALLAALLAGAGGLRRNKSLTVAGMVDVFVCATSVLILALGWWEGPR